MSKKKTHTAAKVFIIFAVAALLTGLAGRLTHDPFEDAKIIPHYVEDGEALWTIAVANKLPDMDTRDYIHKVQEHNGIGSDIKWGDEIEIFTWEESQ